MAAKPKTEDSSAQESPILKALRDFEEEKGLKGWNKESSIHCKLAISSALITQTHSLCAAATLLVI